MSGMRSTTASPELLAEETHVYTYFRSSCSARLRIALALKGLAATYHYVNLIKGEHKEPTYASHNPSQSVPTLEIKSGSRTVSITQSIPALEYLDEAYPETRQLLPNIEEPEKRALVRTLCAIIASDTQPVTNMRILMRARLLSTTPDETANAWARELMHRGLKAYEAVCRDVAGEFSVGDEITMADVCLVPAVWSAERFGVDFGNLPTVRRVFERLSKEEAVLKSHWKNQGDTPEDLRN